jgi:ubiquinone/menaquinone biosynthesis C-methylase UbiE
MPWALRDAEFGPKLLEIGPGPGLTTDLLRHKTEQLTSIEIDERLASALQRRLQGSNVKVVNADATAMPFEDASFSGVVSMTMLHHVPSPELQDRLFAEVFRVLQPGAIFAGSDSTPSLRFRLAHLFDTMVLVDPETLSSRLQKLGFTGVNVREGKGAFRFRATRPQ